ncbi:MAG: RIO1 family regulatory kinase/ATPase, partial [Armatimonadota bacterium]
MIPVAVNGRRLSRSEVEQNTVDYYRLANGTRPDLRLVRLDERMLIVKDFRRSDRLFRDLVGPILIRREMGALRKLSGVVGIPKLIGRIDRHALAMEHIPGRSLDLVEPGTLGPDFYEALQSVLDAMHARGVAHCDLRSRGNVMLGEDGRPYVVDFAACVFRGRGMNPLIRWVFDQFVLADCNAVLLVKQRMSPELLTDEDRAALA